MLDVVPAQAEALPLRIAMDDGVELAADAWGDPAHQPVILLHGGGQTRHAWKDTAAILARRGFRTMAVDLRGHGESQRSPDADYRLDRFAADVRTLARHCSAPPVLVGASLGGVGSIIAVGEAPRPIARALVLVDITPRVDPEGVARIHGFMTEHLDDGFASLEEAADAIAAYLPHRPRPSSLDGLRKNLQLGADGRYRWHYDPAFVRGVETGDSREREQRLTAAAARISVPVLLVRGGSSELVSEAAARDFVANVPDARYVDVPGARHIVAGDLNDPFTREIMCFLDELRTQAR